MSKVIPSIEFESFSGKLSRKSRIVLRSRNGRTHAYALDNPFHGTASADQAQTRSTFSEAVKQASAILRDPALREEWEKRYAAYRKHFRIQAPTPANPNPKNHFCSTLRGFIISTLKSAAN